MTHKVMFYLDDAGEHRWRRIAANGDNVASSGEGYKNYADARKMAQDVNGDEVEYLDEAP